MPDAEARSNIGVGCAIACAFLFWLFNIGLSVFGLAAHGGGNPIISFGVAVALVAVGHLLPVIAAVFWGQIEIQVQVSASLLARLQRSTCWYS